MNILLANWYYKPVVGGVENSLFHVGRILSDLNHVPVIIASDAGSQDNQPLPLHEQLEGIDVYRFSTSRFSLVAPFLPRQAISSASRRIREVAQRFPFDLAIARHHLMVLAIRQAFPDLPTAYVIPGVVANQYKKELQRHISHHFSRRLKIVYQRLVMLPRDIGIQQHSFQYADQLIVFSANMYEQVVSAGYKDLSRLHILTPGVDTTRFTPLLDKYKLRRQMGINDNTFVCLVVGRLAAVKGFDLALHALAKLQDYADIALIIVGDGPQANSLRSLAQELGINQRVRFMGKTMEPEQYFGIADCFLMTSTHEAFGQTILEAMAAELPVVAFSGPEVTTATSEIVMHGETGLLCKFGINPLAEAVLALCQMSSQERMRLGKNAREAVIENFSWMNFTQSLLGLMTNHQ